MEEHFDIVDEHDRVIGRAARSVVHAKGLRHRAVHVFVEDCAGRIYLQLRAPTKDLHPNTWDSSASGHVSSGDDYDVTAVRELEEELGLSDPDLAGRLRQVFRVGAHPLTGAEFVHLYHLRHDGPLLPNPAEITRGEWLSPAEIDARLAAAADTHAPAFAALWRRWRGTPRPDDPPLLA